MGSSSDWKKRLKVLLCQEDKKRESARHYMQLYICVSLFQFGSQRSLNAHKEKYIYIYMLLTCVLEENGGTCRVPDGLGCHKDLIHLRIAELSWRRHVLKVKHTRKGNLRLSKKKRAKEVNFSGEGGASWNEAENEIKCESRQANRKIERQGASSYFNST